ncbi:hypothetical protein SHJG_4881 [Streptomyces hygroscopicus subsp. jinggangensis 5008]|nr:hypothetical protein SHJG_4881 [Streptomyces hygroscopicus subsp. jinggangensis 5008]AGF64307.1 hypothetical protein SHJGH_4644 [Streptomyces hygroscopicus subsp. jinggangensis TL01]
MVALVARATGRRLTLATPRAIRAALPTLLAVVTTVSPAWWLFATRGTLDGHPGDSGRCPASNVPPRWPDWLPA